MSNISHVPGSNLFNSSISTQNLLASFAGGQQRTDQVKERTATQQKQAQTQQDVLEISVQKAEDVADADFSQDRDANGFYLPEERQQDPEQHEHTEESAPQPESEPQVRLQTDENLGMNLDLEA